MPFIKLFLLTNIRSEEIMEQPYDYDFDIYDLIDKWE
nr:MAG TPA: hypothetical protein [Caudoviricetes sp.]DAY39879.1 MAG TPA: hypothetical protein [Caudoviricetes sp.]